MKEQRITIDIDAEGKVTAEAEGFSGDACLKEIDRLLEGITAARVRVDRKPDAAEAQARARAAKAQTAGRKS